MKKIIKTIIFLCSFVLPISAVAWWQTGHMVIAQIAYDHLTPQARKEVDAIVPMMRVENRAGIDYANFIRLAPWADDVKEEGLHAFDAWHFDDQPFSTDGTPLPHRCHSKNVAWAINQMANALKHKEMNPYDRARALAFLVHFVGDAHQPLHDTNRISAEYPQGDEAGNYFPLHYRTKSGEKIANLHELWDDAVEFFSQKGFSDEPTSPNEIAQIAKVIEADYPEKYFGQQVNQLNPYIWTKEGLTISKNIVYRNIQENGKPSKQYLEANSKIAEQRLALAGYRLANLLNKQL